MHENVNAKMFLPVGLMDINGEYRRREETGVVVQWCSVEVWRAGQVAGGEGEGEGQGAGKEKGREGVRRKVRRVIRGRCARTETAGRYVIAEVRHPKTITHVSAPI